jgi:hypothetical protein
VVTTARRSWSQSRIAITIAMDRRASLHNRYNNVPPDPPSPKISGTSSERSRSSSYVAENLHSRSAIVTKLRLTKDAIQGRSTSADSVPISICSRYNDKCTGSALHRIVSCESLDIGAQSRTNRNVEYRINDSY